MNTWQKSSHCHQNGCIEATAAAGRTLIRDSKNPDHQPLSLTRSGWAALRHHIKAST